LIDAVAKLRSQQDSKDDGKDKCELKVPSEDEIDGAISSMTLEEEGHLNYDEYLIALFRVTQEGLD
jgi:hypothetical protein